MRCTKCFSMFMDIIWDHSNERMPKIISHFT